MIPRINGVLLRNNRWIGIELRLSRSGSRRTDTLFPPSFKDNFV